MGKKSSRNSGSSSPKGGGVMMGMRAQMKRLGGANSKKGKGKRQWTFGEVMGIVLGIAALLILIYALSNI